MSEKNNIKQIGTVNIEGNEVPEYEIELTHDGQLYNATTIHPDWDDVSLWAVDDVQEMIGREAYHMSNKEVSKIKHYRKSIDVKPLTGEFVKYSPSHDAVLLENGYQGHRHYFTMVHRIFVANTRIIDYQNGFDMTHICEYDIKYRVNDCVIAHEENGNNKAFMHIQSITSYTHDPDIPKGYCRLNLIKYNLVITDNYKHDKI